MKEWCGRGTEVGERTGIIWSVRCGGGCVEEGSRWGWCEQGGCGWWWWRWKLLHYSIDRSNRNWCWLRWRRWSNVQVMFEWWQSWRFMMMNWMMINVMRWWRGRDELGICNIGRHHLVGCSVSVGWFEWSWLMVYIVLDTMMYIILARVCWLSLICHCGMEAVIIRHIADCLYPAIR